MNDISTDIPAFDLATIPMAEGSNLDVFGVELQLNELPHLDSDQKYEVSDTDRSFRDARQAKTAIEALGRLPGPREAIHLAISGKFALYDLIPAALHLAAPATIKEIHIATLGFSKNNIIALCELLDAGKIGQLSLLCSHYFKGTSPEIHTLATEELAKRNQSFLSIRNHAKLLCMKFTDGRTLTVESSANLRSCKNIEIMTLIGGAGLYDFHVGWIKGLSQ